MDGILKVFSPVEVLNKLYDIDPVSARFLTAGVGVFAAAAIVLAYKIDTATMLLVGVYILGMSLLLSIVSTMPPILKHILGTFLVLTIISTVMLFFASVIWKWPQPAYCLAKFWLECPEAARQTAQANAKSLDAKVELPARIELPAAAQVLDGDEIVTTATVRKSTATGTETQGGSTAPALRPVARAPVPAAASQPVYIQYAGLITRESIGGLNRALLRGGWDVQGPGEPIDGAPTRNEVRYSDPKYLPAAQALADAVTATKISSSPVTPRLFRGSGPNLELWISN